MFNNGESLIDDEEFNVGDYTTPITEEDNDDETTENNVEDIPLYDEEDLPKNNTQSSEASKENTSPFASALTEKFGWDNVPDNIDPVEALETVTKGYEELLAKKDAELESLKNVKAQTQISDELQQYRVYTTQMKTLSEKDFVKQVLITTNEYDINDQKDIELLEDEISDLEINGTLGKTYQREFRKWEKQSNKYEQELQQYVQQQGEIEAKQLELEQREFVTMMTQETQTFNSEYIAVTNEDREMLRGILLNRTETGKTPFETLLEDPKAVMEMVLSYLKLPEWKSVNVKAEKKAVNQVINNMSDNPIINPKITKQKTMKDYLETLEDLTYA